VLSRSADSRSSQTYEDLCEIHSRQTQTKAQNSPRSHNGLRIITTGEGESQPLPQFPDHMCAQIIAGRDYSKKHRVEHTELLLSPNGARAHSSGSSVGTPGDVCNIEPQSCGCSGIQGAPDMRTSKSLHCKWPRMQGDTCSNKDCQSLMMIKTKLPYDKPQELPHSEWRQKWSTTLNQLMKTMQPSLECSSTHDVFIHKFELVGRSSKPEYSVAITRTFVVERVDMFWWNGLQVPGGMDSQRSRNSIEDDLVQPSP
jgi:hypothetical protein